jgi:hypothetical protein
MKTKITLPEHLEFNEKLDLILLRLEDMINDKNHKSEVFIKPLYFDMIN